MITIHSAECRNGHRAVLDGQAEYDALWPNHCTTCQGTGVVGTGEMERDTGWVDVEPCPDCAEVGKCARCGRQIQDAYNLDAEPIQCPDCGWDEASPDARPREDACLCWLEAGIPDDEWVVF